MDVLVCSSKRLQKPCAPACASQAAWCFFGCLTFVVLADVGARIRGFKAPGKEQLERVLKSVAGVPRLLCWSLFASTKGFFACLAVGLLVW